MALGNLKRKPMRQLREDWRNMPKKSKKRLSIKPINTIPEPPPSEDVPPMNEPLDVPPPEMPQEPVEDSMDDQAEDQTEKNADPLAILAMMSALHAAPPPTGKETLPPLPVVKKKKRSPIVNAFLEG